MNSTQIAEAIDTSALNYCGQGLSNALSSP